MAWRERTRSPNELIEALMPYLESESAAALHRLLEWHKAGGYCEWYGAGRWHRGWGPAQEMERFLSSLAWMDRMAWRAGMRRGA